MVEKHGVEVRRRQYDPHDIPATPTHPCSAVWRDPFIKRVVDSQKEYASLLVPYRRSVWPPYEFASDYYWKDLIYLK